jgi:hypothetical protein
MTLRTLLLLCCALQIAEPAIAADYYVSKDGSDRHPGTLAQPFLTISQALEVLHPGDTCWIDDGIYGETVTPPRSGEVDAPISFKRLNPEGRVLIAGVDRIDRNAWKRISDHLFVADCDMALDHENQVFLDDQMLFEARWPNTGNVLLEPTLAEMETGTTKDMIVDSSLPDYDYEGAKVWIHAKHWWSNWTTTVTGNPGIGQLEINDTAPFFGARRHVAADGAQYFVFGIMGALDAENEWFYNEEERKLYIFRPDGQLPEGDYFIKSRMLAMDLRGRSHIQMEGIDIFAATIETDAASSHLVFDRMVLTYPYFSCLADQKTGLGQTDKGLRLLGSHCVVRNSEIAYSSGTGVALFGENNQILNCYIHDHDFIGTYASCVQLGGKGNVISHSTLTRSGRSVIGYASMYQALIQYCDMSYAGMLTSDLGLTYGNVIEGGNSEVRYNVLHDNQGRHFNMGLYYDHGTQNIISHHNIVYGVTFSAFQLNHYAAYHLVYNNTFISDTHGFRSMWGNQYEPDLNGVRIVNNIFSGMSETAAPRYHWSSNIVEYEGFDRSEPFRFDHSLARKGPFIHGISKVEKGKLPAIGAIESESLTFKVGHDFENPPEIDTTRSKPLHRNLIRNSAFEHEDNLMPWIADGNVQKINHELKIQIDEDTAVGRMGRHSIELKVAGSEISQSVSGLQPSAVYRFSAYLRVEKGEVATIGVRYADGTEFLSPHVASGAPRWRRVNLSFAASDSSDEVSVFVRRTSNGEGTIHVDDTGLILESHAPTTSIFQHPVK